MNHPISNNHSCIYCDRAFRFKDLYEQHRVTCEYFYKEKKEKDREQEIFETLPSPQETYKLIQSLMLKCNQLEKEVGELKRVSNTRIKKKVSESISHMPSDSWKEWMKRTNINDIHLQRVYKEDLLEGIKYYISDLIRETGANELPFYSSKETPNILFVYSVFEESSKSHWKKVNANEFEKAINEIAHRFLQEFTKMQNENIDKICSNNEEREKNIVFMMKINTMKTTTEKRSNEIKKWLISKVIPVET